MVKQDAQVAYGLTKRFKTERYDLFEFVQSLSVEEWKEYLLYLLFFSHDIRNGKPNFEYQTHEKFVEFPFEHGGGKGEDISVFYATFETFKNCLRPERKRLLQEAINELVIENLNDEDFIRILLDETYHFCEGRNRLFSFYQESLFQIARLSISEANKLLAVTMFTHLEGIEAPSKEAMKDFLKSFRGLYKHEDVFLHQAIYGFFHNELYLDGLETMSYLQKEWPPAHRFEVMLAKAFGEICKQGKLQNVVEKIVPQLAPKIRKEFVKILKRGAKDPNALFKQQSLLEEKFGVSISELSLIQNIKV